MDNAAIGFYILVYAFTGTACAAFVLASTIASKDRHWTDYAISILAAVNIVVVAGAMPHL